MKQKKTVAATIDMETAAIMEEKIQKMRSTKSAFVRAAIQEYIEDGVNKPLITFSIVELISEVEQLKRILPSKKYEKLENCVQNIMNCIGGEYDDAT